MKDLIVAEKPSVARDIASALGGFSEKKGYLESDNTLITWSVGHLLGLSYPQAYPGWNKTWKFEQLPMIPDNFLINPIGDKRSREQLKTIKKLMTSSQTATIINACDAGREGELIFAYLYQYAQASNPIERMWLQSMTKESIKTAYKNRRRHEDFLGLEAAARSRSEADWVFGINGTQAATLSLSPLKLDVVSLGRVQTPTLAILQRREKEINDFSPKPYSLVEADFKTKDGKTYKGRIKEEFSKKEAAKIVSECSGKNGEILSLKKTEKKKEPPLLFDLTSLQREVGSRYGFTAKRTLALAQRLYEHHKVLSYPRTSSRFLPSDMESETILRMKASSIGDLDSFLPQKIDASQLPRVFDDSKVTDHYAIVPTEKAPSGLDADEMKIYDLVRRRLFAVFMDPVVIENTRFDTKVENYIFKTSGFVYKSLGWRQVEAGSDEKKLPKLANKDVVSASSVQSLDLETKPPKRYSDASLLSAMETAGRELEDDDLREAMKESGLGTPATRSAIIERLIEVGYVERTPQKSLKVPEKGVVVIDLLDQLQDKTITSPALTGSWEKRLIEIEKDPGLRDGFMKDVAAAATEMVLELEKIVLDPDLIKKVAIDEVLGPCPFCQKPVRENRRAFSCWSRQDPGCGFSIWKKVAGKKLPREAIIDLYQNQKTTNPVEGFKSKKGRAFKANLKLEMHDKKTVISFDEEWASQAQESSGPAEES